MPSCKDPRIQSLQTMMEKRFGEYAGRYVMEEKGRGGRSSDDWR